MPSHPADLPGVMELARFAVAGGFHHLSREAAQAARGCVAVWLEDVLRASIQVMQANNRFIMRLSDVKDGIRVCISRITYTMSEVYGTNAQKIRIRDGAYYFDDSNEAEPEELKHEEDEDDEEDDNDSFADDAQSDDEVASEDLVCDEELTASEDDDEEEEDLILTPCSNLEVAPTVEEKELRHIEGVAPAGESAEESDHYRPSIHPDVVSKLIRGELDKYKTDVRISIELQFFIHMWLEQRLLESFRADETCELVLMTAIYQGRRLPLGVINELTKPQAPSEPSPPQPRATASTPIAGGKRTRQVLMTSYSSSPDSNPIKDAGMSPIAASSSAARQKRARPSDVTQAGDTSLWPHGDEELERTFDRDYQVATSSREVSGSPDIRLELTKFRQSTDQLYSLLSEYNSKEPVGQLKKRVADLEAELAMVKQKYNEARGALDVAARHAQGILAFCNPDSSI